MPTAPVGDLEIEYRVDGPADGAPLALVNGLGSQLIRWDPGFTAALVDAGFRVLAFDNRDVGLSTWLDEPVDVVEVVLEAASGGRPEVPYLLADMAADVVGLLDHLGLERAHVAGTSMGGMIAQATAIEHPDRVASLTSIMSSTGEPGVGGPTGEALEALLSPVPDEREGYLDRCVANARVFAGEVDWDEPYWRDLYARQYDRAHHPAGEHRQLAAVSASGARAAGLAALDVPTVVVHGDADPLVQPSGGERTAELVPGAELTVVPGMGHDLPPRAWPAIVGAIARAARRAGAAVTLPDGR